MKPSLYLKESHCKLCNSHTFTLAFPPQHTPTLGLFALSYTHSRFLMIRGLSRTISLRRGEGLLSLSHKGTVMKNIRGEGNTIHVVFKYLSGSLLIEMGENLRVMTYRGSSHRRAV
jgi:hypothetical protein